MTAPRDCRPPEGTSDGTVPPVPPDNIVRLTDVLAKKPYSRRECAHARLEVDATNRRVECRDCNREVDAFEAISILADNASAYQRTYDQMRKDHQNLAGWVPHLRAVRDLEGMWRGKRLPMCPHCKKGVTAEGLNSMGWVHQAYAEAVAKHEAETTAPAAVHSIAEPPHE